MSGTKRPGHTLSSVDSASNIDIADIIGQKGDTHDGNSLYSLIKKIDEHAHNAQNVYPTLAAGVTVTASNAGWTLGNFIEIIPINTITEDFDIHFLCISEISANDDYELVLYAGEVEIGRVCFIKSAAGEPSQPVRIQTPIILANTQIQAKLACNDAVARTIVLKLEYHIY